MNHADAYTSLRYQLRGACITPDDADYDDARHVYNAMIERYPRFIARCADVADVMRCVRFAADNEVLVSIRGGGHNGGGLGVCDDGLVIELSRLRGIRADPQARTVRVEGGCTWGDVDHATHAFGLATPAGIISTTGVGGLTLGGGIGHLTRCCGLTIDNLLGADLVLADGRFVSCDADQNADLFWAIRGGGGNFGVVTSFLFRLHPIHTVTGGPMFWPIERTVEVMQWYREFIAAAPEALNGWLAFVKVPPVNPFPAALHGHNVCAVVWCFTGPEQQADAVYKPVRALRPVFDGVGPLPYPMLQSLFDPLYPPGMQWYWRADFVNQLSDPAIAEHLRFGSQLPSGPSTMHLYPISGAAHRVGRNHTAFSYRDANWAQVIVGVDPDPANAETITRWTKSYWEATHPHGAGGAYVNFMMDEGQQRVQASYRDNYDRLAAVKREFDPGNLFRVNQNIHPAS